MSIDLDEIERKMNGAVDAFHNDLSGLRTGRASASFIEDVMVDVYGAQMPLNQVATIGVPEPRMLTAQVWDKSNVQAVEKAIINADLGLNPATDGQLIRMPMPLLTEERRKEMVKIAGKYAEEKRIAIRNIRRDGMELVKKLEKDGEISQDEMHAQSDNVQSITDKYIAKIDESLTKKEADIMTV